MSKKSFKEELRVRNVSNTPESRSVYEQDRRFGDHFDSDRNRRSLSNGTRKEKPDKQNSER